MVKIFDLALKQEKGGNISEGYEFSDGRIYKAYYTYDEWCKFKNYMKANHSTAYAQFESGKGKELEEGINRYGKKIPPKMASYASSSRFIFELSKLFGDDFTYEYKLPIAFRGFGGEAKASLDGYMESKRIFVEAKCREIYTGAFSEYKPSYENFYEYLKKETDERLDYSIERKGEKQYIRFKWDNKKLETLDLKQLLCHMLGIGKKALLENSQDVSTLIYLVFNPNYEVLDHIDDEDDKKFIRDMWNNERKEVKSIDFKLLYKLIVIYIFNEKKNYQKEGTYSSRVDEISELFEFKFCDQRDYLDIVNKIEEIK